MGENGDRFILDMGEPVRIAELAKEMIRLSGKTLGEDIEIAFTSLLPGEKMDEKLHTEDEQLGATSHSKIKRIEGSNFSPGDWRILQEALNNVDALEDSSGLDWLRKSLPSFRPE
jgi:FlaA1/EpsC-like NDP-sugar epimerase